MLQAVHPIADHPLGRCAISRFQVIEHVPSAPSGLSLGHKPGIAVQIGLVGRVTDGAEKCALLRVRICEGAEALIRMAGHDHLIVVRRLSRPVCDQDAARLALNSDLAGC